MSMTSVKVALRIRPLSKKEIAQSCSEVITTIPDTTQVVMGQDRPFTYDYVFPSDSSQEEVFDECAKPLLQKLIEGYNVTILAYGQTGSGKTHSMGTNLEDTVSPEHKGMVPRTIETLFQELASRREKNPQCEFEVLVSFLELYNEDLNDLLNPLNRESGKKGKSELMIREDANGQIYWAGVKEVSVNSPEELLAQLSKGSTCRTVASTEMNSVSSRSHAIFSVILRQTRVESLEDSEPQSSHALQPSQPAAESSKKKKPKGLTAKITSKFHFVDLAGSERLKRTNAVGDRAKEGIAINGGLLALGNVISALGDESRKVTHIPYRDSKLTRLLQDSLGGNSQTLMLACVSPADSNFMETLNTLKYANRARNIKNKVSVNESFSGNAAEINQLRGLVSKLKGEIQQLRDGGADGETAQKYEEEIIQLKNELGISKQKIKQIENDLIAVNTEKQTLLLHVAYHDQDLTDEQRKNKIETSDIIRTYEQQIFDYKNQVAELQAAAAVPPRKSSLAGSTPGKERGHIKFIDDHHDNSSEDEAAAESEEENKENIKMKRRLKRYHRNSGSEESSSNGNSADLTHDFVLKNIESAKSLLDYYNKRKDHDNNDEVGENGKQHTDGESSDKSSKQYRKLRRRSSANSSLDKAQEHMKEVLKNGDSMHDDPLLSQIIKTPSSTKSESYIDQMWANNKNEKRRSSSVSFSEIQQFEVPQWEESNPTQSSNRRGSNSSRSVSFSDPPISPNSTKSSQNSTGMSSQQNAVALTRMLHQIQSDIAVKEQLVNQLEHAEQEFTYMRSEYEQRLRDMQENLIGLQRERDTAVKRATNNGVGISKRDSQSLLLEMKVRYEHKMKQLIQEIGTYRRKYNEATQACANMKNQNEAMIKSLKAQIEQLKAEKVRILEKTKEAAKGVREMLQSNRQEVQELRRREKSMQESNKKLQRTNDMQRIMLDKRAQEIVEASGKFKSVLNLLKKTSPPKVITKVFRNKKNKIIPENEPNRSNSDDYSNIHDEIFGSGIEKKKLINEAINKYIISVQQYKLLDELVIQRNSLLKEREENIKYREKVRIDEPILFAAEVRGIDEKLRSIDLTIHDLNHQISTIRTEMANNIIDTTTPNEVNEEDKNKAGQQRKRSNPDATYNTVVTILRNLDGIESQTLVESFFEDICSLRLNEIQTKESLSYHKEMIGKLLQDCFEMRKHTSDIKNKYEKKLRRIESKMNDSSRSTTPDSLEIPSINDLNLYHETAFSRYTGSQSSSRTGSKRNSIVDLSSLNNYNIKDFSSVENSQPNNVVVGRSLSSRPSLPIEWVNSPLSENDETIVADNVEVNRSISPLPEESPINNNTLQHEENHEENHEDKHEEKLGPKTSKATTFETIDSPRTPRTPAVERLSRNNSISNVSPRPTHSRDNSSSMGFYGNGRDSGYFSSYDKRRSQTSMGARDEDHQPHVRSYSPAATGSVFDRLAKGHTHSSTAKSIPSSRSSTPVSPTLLSRSPSPTSPIETSIFDRLSKSHTKASAAKRS
ncbi:4216_t:CDS:2 [Diversispora eburnea]|uniref:4216_t:CDS:1 n=1 Tax=Diversispora eburnea TaxID=1213867 RepID=A0A9N8YP28_9GLOM|nr:4216_t:CDS:2 [Diversispora eburnea]